ncbi:MAG: methylenetetrahydrofolate reductase [NAD(P)H] [Phycisphaerales bacterium JB039]
MHIADIMQRHRVSCSFEFFPPRSAEAAEDLYRNISELEQLKPSFVSVTYGAGGSTRELTNELVLRIKRETSLDPTPHLTGVCHDARDLEAILTRYAEAGISNIVALRGDAPEDAGGNGSGDPYEHFPYGADVVRYIRRFCERHGHPDPRGFGICVAGYPEGHAATPNRLVEMDRLKEKVDAGADVIVTQLFFDNRDFYDFRERCELAGIRVPVIAGIMPITSEKGMKRMAELALGARYPAPLLRAIRRCQGDPAAVRRVGVHWATEQCRDLLDHNVAGLHLYTLNKSTATREIYKTLGVRDSRGMF